jgi:hypothetical protein
MTFSLSRARNSSFVLSGFRIAGSDMMPQGVVDLIRDGNPEESNRESVSIAKFFVQLFISRVCFRLEGRCWTC